MLPSDYFHRNVFAGFHEDAMGIRDRNVIGVDNLLWGSDYPHVESTFPRSRQIIEEILKDCTEEEKADGRREAWSAESQVRSGLAGGGKRIRTCMGLFLSSGCFGFC